MFENNDLIHHRVSKRGLYQPFRCLPINPLDPAKIGFRTIRSDDEDGPGIRVFRITVKFEAANPNSNFFHTTGMQFEQIAQELMILRRRHSTICISRNYVSREFLSVSHT